ncbi:MAG TPA: molecular chaperone TorD family protein [Anaeromyxobacteraceae bacterium]|nr:molecular chaperone TorD family protein [Anaeromyxobacteraceae bacterium]
MVDRDAIRIALAAIAELLEYPSRDPRPPLARVLARVGPRVGRDLDRFAGWALGTAQHDREELYGTTFDLAPICPPYVGHHLVGESPLRGVFLARLAGVYAAHGFVPPPGELPDHLATALRFAATAHGRDRDVLVEDGLVPAIAKMREALRGRPNPYRHLLAGVQRLLEAEVASRPRPVPAEKEVAP